MTEVVQREDVAVSDAQAVLEDVRMEYDTTFYLLNRSSSTVLRSNF